MGATQSQAVFAEGPMHVTLVYPASYGGEDTCAMCGSNEWSHPKPVPDLVAAQVPRQLAGRVPLDAWLRLLDDCYASTVLDNAYYKFGFPFLLLWATLCLLILSPTLGPLIGGPVALGSYMMMGAVYKVLALRLNRKLAAIVHAHRPIFEQLGCSITWRQSWVGGVEALSRYVWIEICVLAENGQPNTAVRSDAQGTQGIVPARIEEDGARLTIRPALAQAAVVRPRSAATGTVHPVSTTGTRQGGEIQVV